MAADGIGREEVGCCPLHAQAVAGIGVVGKPEFLVKGGGADIEPAAAGRAALERDAREFLPQAAHGGVIVRDVVEEEVALLLCRQVGGAGIAHFPVAIPLDVGNARILCQGAAHGCIDACGRVG